MIRIKLSAILGEQRITQADLARMTKIRPATINEMYHELSERVNLEYLDRICETLNCDITDLLKYEPNNVKSKSKGKEILINSEFRRRKG